MARIRSIKPEFWTSEQVMECSPNARLMFIGLWNFSDDAGRHPLSEKRIKAEIFPADDISSSDIRHMLDELAANDLIITYAVDGKEYLQVTGWHHQKIDRPQLPKYPEPPDDPTPPSSNDRRTIATDRIGGEGKEGRESSDDDSHTGDFPSPQRAEDFDAEFEAFWQAYPRRAGNERKKDGKAKFVQLRKRGVPLDDLMAGARRYAAYCRREYGDERSRYIQQLPTWLNDDAWTQDYGTANSQAPPDPPWKSATDDQWRREGRNWLQDGSWSKGFGPPPDAPDCRMPAHIARELDIAEPGRIRAVS